MYTFAATFNKNLKLKKMKKLNSILMLSAFAGSLFFASCTPDDATDAGATATITRKSPTADVVPIVTGDSLTVQYVLGSDKELKTLSITKNGTALDLNGTATGNDLAVSGTNFTYNGSFQVTGSVGSIETYIFTVTDKKDNTASDTIKVDVIAAAIALTEKVNGIVSNVQGPNQGAFDLVGEARVSSSGSASIKDLLDQSTVSPNGVVYTKTFGSGNGTTFVKAGSSFSYATATNTSAASEFGAGSASASTAVLAVGDVYIAKNSRFSNGHVVIKITAVNETSSDNTDNITFTYKK